MTPAARAPASLLHRSPRDDAREQRLLVSGGQCAAQAAREQQRAVLGLDTAQAQVLAGSSAAVDELTQHASGRQLDITVGREE
jgi:hypothetical protein